MHVQKILIASNEIVLKGANRGWFQGILKTNIKNKFENKGLSVSVNEIMGKFLVNVKEKKLDELYQNKKIEVLRDLLHKTPGIKNFEFVYEVETDIEKIKDLVVKKIPLDWQEFKVETRRSWKGFSMTSPEVNRAVGMFVEKKLGKKVNLKQEKFVVNIRILKDKTFIGFEKLQGMGGLPVGSGGKVVSLLSGGIDSPVSSWFMIKRGLKVNFLHGYNSAIAGDNLEKKIFGLVEQLSEFQGKSNLYLVDTLELSKLIVSKVDEKYRMIIFKISLILLANKLARSLKAKAIVTGDNIGQVASQTLENLNTIWHFSDLPVFAPLIGFDKLDIIQLAQQIGTYDISLIPYQDCCSLIAGKHPETKGKIEKVKGIISDINLIDFINSINFQKIEIK